MSKGSVVTQIPEPALSKYLFADTRLSWLWVVVRVYVGWEWLTAGWGKVTSPMWVGPKAGVALMGFIHGAIAKTSGPHPDVQGWYADFLQHAVIPNVATFSHMVAFGETLIGIALILGAFTGIAAFFGAFMNMNFMLAGAVSINPILFLCELFLILAWRVAGWLGLDRYFLPYLGTPWNKGNVFKSKTKK